MGGKRYNKLVFRQECMRAPTSPSHPEYAEPGVRHRRVERGAEAEPERAPGVHRVEDAVVPESAGGEERKRHPIAATAFQDLQMAKKESACTVTLRWRSTGSPPPRTAR